MTRKVRVYTLRYEPFIMGGSVWQPVAANVEWEGEYDLGKGYRGYLIISPNGKTFVAESQSGAFVGPSIQQVREDIAESEDIDFMKKQVEDAKIQSKQATEIPADEFWRLLRG
jgi:hypothetical protein